MAFYRTECADEGAARAQLGAAIAERTKLGKHRESLRDRRNELYDKIDAAEAEIAGFMKSAEQARDNFALAEIGAATIEKAPQALAIGENVLDLGRRRLAALERGHQLIDADESATDQKVKDSTSAIDYYVAESLRLSPAVIALQDRCSASWREYMMVSNLLSDVNGLRHSDTSHQIPADPAIVNQWKQAILALKTDASVVLPE